MSRAMRRAAALALVAAVASGCAHRAPATDAAHATIGSSLAARATYPSWASDERVRLRRELDADFTAVRARSGNGLVVIGADGSVLYNVNGAAPRTPASTLKVLTAATALATLGPAHRFTTRLAAERALDDGVLPGDLYLIGGGDPTLSSDDLHDGVAALRKRGLTRVTGRAVVDASAFSGPEQNPRWAPDDLNLDYAAGTSALSLDGDVAIFAVRPTVVGAPAAVRLIPPNAGVVLRGSVLTYSAGAAPGVRIDHVPGRNAFVLGGGIGQGEEQRFPIPVGDVTAYVAGSLDTMLARAKISAGGRATPGPAPIGARTLWQHRSAPLRDIAHHMLLVSDNHVAEQLLRLVALYAGRGGTEKAGIRAEHDFLRRVGIVDAGMRVYDGSGLAPADRIAPLTLAQVLADAAARPGSPLVLGLPRVGVEGTVRDHTLHDAAGRVRAKSGHISGVDGLAGVVQSRTHGPLAFAFIGNDVDDATIEDAEDRALDQLSRF